MTQRYTHFVFKIIFFLLPLCAEAISLEGPVSQASVSWSGGPCQAGKQYCKATYACTACTADNQSYCNAYNSCQNAWVDPIQRFGSRLPGQFFKL